MQTQAPEAFTAAPCTLSCMDTWPLAQVRGTAMLAYRELDRLGQIALQYPLRLYGDRVEIRYLSAGPHEWTREGLKQAEGRLREVLIEDQKALAKRIESMVQGITADMLTLFGEIAERHRQISLILEGDI